MREMLTKAYCFEYHQIEEAESAKRRRQSTRQLDHWFCCECRIPVTPKISPLKNFFFSALPGNLHVPGCPHEKEKTSGAYGMPVHTVGVPLPPVFPDVLGEAPPKPRRQFIVPSDVELQKLISSAPTAHIYGDLYEVMCAWETMSDALKVSHPLNLSSQAMTYDEAIIDLDRRKQIPGEKFWPERIYHFGAKLTAGKVAGYYFIKSLERFAGRDGPLHITARIALKGEGNSGTPPFPQEILNLNKVRIYWNGNGPTLNTKDRMPSYSLGDGSYARFDNLAISNRCLIDAESEPI